MSLDDTPALWGVMEWGHFYWGVYDIVRSPKVGVYIPVWRRYIDRLKKVTK